jgi:hypothetical protein
MGCSKLQSTVSLGSDAPTDGRLQIRVRDAVHGTDLISPLDAAVGDKFEIDAELSSLARVRLETIFTRTSARLGGSTAVFGNARLVC